MTDRRFATTAAAFVLGAACGGVQAQPADRPASPLADAALTWQQCQRLSGSSEARLACFDRWAQQQTLPAAVIPSAPPVLASTPPPPIDASMPATRVVAVTTEQGCRDTSTPRSRASGSWRKAATAAPSAFAATGR